MQELEKIGLVGLYTVKQSKRRKYITLDPKTVEAYDVQIGDVLKVEILEVRRKPKEGS